MIGTFLNVTGVLIGGIIGLFFGHLISEKLQESIMKVTGLCVIF